MDYFELLGVSRQATSAEIRQAYARLARESHPDRFPDPAQKQAAQERFKQITTAFNTLSNDRSRREYEEELARPKAAAPEEIGRDALARGVKALEAKDYHSAVELLRSAVGLLPDLALAHFHLGRALSKNPHWVRDAIRSVEKAAELDPKKSQYELLLAELYHAQGLAIRARKHAEAALRLAPSDPETRRVAAMVGLDPGAA